MTSLPAVVIDNGTGYTKMGYAGNVLPEHIIPTTIATNDVGAGETKKDDIRDLDFHIGDDALKNSDSYRLNYPINEGQIDNWNNMERLWQRCIFKHMRCEPENHFFMLTEPPMNKPENRELTAEIMFETFNVPGLYIAVQAVLALYTSAMATGNGDVDAMTTGTVIDSGDGVTHVVPVYNGYVLGSCIRHIPLAGRNVTDFTMKFMRSRGEPIPPEIAKSVAKTVKERYSYTCRDVVKEFQKFDKHPEKYFKTFSGTHRDTKWTCGVGYERFLGPEVFFNPEIFNADHPTPLPNVVVESILATPIDCRRSLYKNIVLSGGSTMFKDFNKRLQKDIKSIVKAGIVKNRKAVLGDKWKDGKKDPMNIDINVIAHDYQRFAVWFGGSMMAGADRFEDVCHTKAQYEDEGPRICRHNAAFQHL